MRELDVPVAGFARIQRAGIGLNSCESSYSRLVRHKPALALEKLKREENPPLLSIARHRLALGRASFGLLIKEDFNPGPGQERWEKVQQQISEAKTGLKRAGLPEDIPLGLIANAEFIMDRSERTRAGADLEEAQRDLEEALSISTEIESQTREVDCHLALARLACIRRQQSARDVSLEKAKKLIGETGYEQRRSELEQIQSARGDIPRPVCRPDFISK